MNHRFSTISKISIGLIKVYSLVFSLLVSFAVGSWFSTIIIISNLVLEFILVLVLLLITSIFTNFYIKLLLSNAFAFVLGHLISLMLNFSNEINQMIIPRASFITAGIFLGFSVIPFLTISKNILVFGGLLTGCLTGLLIGGLILIFFPVYQFETLHLLFAFFGIFIFSSYIAYDTTVMIEKIKSGIYDPFEHALDLFIDLMNIFIKSIKILIIMYMKKDNNENETDNSDDDS